MILKQLVFFDFDSAMTKPIAPGISLDQGRNDKFFQLELYIPKDSMEYRKKSIHFIDNILPQNVYDNLPGSILYNMELFAMGNVKKDNYTEYLLFFKPWFMNWEGYEDYLDYLENFIYIVPYRILNHFLAKGIYLENFEFNDLKETRVLENFNENYFNNFLKDYKNLVGSISDLGMSVGKNIYKETGKIILDKEYLISLNNQYLF